MISIVIDVHRNILSAQCTFKCCLTNTSIDDVKVTCSKTHLALTLYHKSELLHEVKILTTSNFFIPSSVLKEGSLFEEIQIENDILTISRKCQYPELDTSARHSQECKNSVYDVTSYHCNKVSACNILNNRSCKDLETNLSIESLCKKINFTKNNATVDNFVDISFRIQVSNSDLISACLSDSQCLYSSLYDFIKSQVICQEAYEVFCSNCGNKISQSPTVFERVQEYCDSFSDLSESWFCHKKIAPHSELQISMLQVSETCLFLQFGNSLSDKAEVKCSSCRVVLTDGCVSDSQGQCLYRFYADAIMLVKQNSKALCTKNYCRNAILLSLLTVISQKSYASRLFFQSKDNGQCLLLWVPPTKTAQFKLQAPLHSLPSQVDFLTEDVYKVQYLTGTMSSPQVKKWSRDFSVDFYRVSASFVDILRELLASSNGRVANEEVSTEDFASGYLPSSLQL